MDIKKAIESRLSTDPTLSGLVSGIFPEKNNVEADYPFITYKIQTGKSEQTFGGTLDIVDASIELYIYALNSTDVSAIYRQIRHLLDGQGGTWNSVTVDNVFLNNVLTMDEYAQDGSGDTVYVGECEYVAIYREDVS